MDCPLYLKQWEALWKTDPRAAKLAWFKEARYGLFLHYGLYSLLHKNEWALYNENIPLAQYEKLAGQFTAHHFDADRITDLALEAGMRYITLTSCHHEGFCLFDSKIEPFNSMNACGRDLVGEMSAACAKKGLGFFTYYTFMLNWRHPYFLPREVNYRARPDYPEGEPRYLYREKADFRKYIDYILAVMDELLDRYEITGMWLDLIMMWYAIGEEYIPIREIYAHLRKRHPETLISWKQGATGDEDFASPESRFRSQEDTMRAEYGEAAAERARFAFEANRDKHNEICSCVQNGSWAYNPMCENKTADEIWDMLGQAARNDCNLLLNVGPMADGSINPRHAQLLRDVGARIRREGYPG